MTRLHKTHIAVIIAASMYNGYIQPAASQPSGFTLTSTVSRHSNQVNAFSDIHQIYRSYTDATQGSTHHVATELRDHLHQKRVGCNEIKMTLAYQEEINPKLRALIAGRGWKPEDQLTSFLTDFTADACSERLKECTALATAVLNWNGFVFTAAKDQIGFEYMTEWTHTAARAIDNVNAFFYAKYLQTYLLPDSPASWESFAQTAVYQHTLPMRKTIEIITAPAKVAVQEGEEAMSLSTAFQDFRRRLPLAVEFLPEANIQTERLFTDRFPSVQAKLARAQEILGTYASTADAYKALKVTSAPELIEANDIRREIGGTGFLIALQQGIKNGLISLDFYEEHKAFIEELVDVTNEMDKCNFEHNLCYGIYTGDAIPSPYAFFLKLAGKEGC